MTLSRIVVHQHWNKMALKNLSCKLHIFAEVSIFVEKVSFFVNFSLFLLRNAILMLERLLKTRLVITYKHKLKN